MNGSPHWPELTVCVAGIGVSGLSAARALAALGARVVAVDGRVGGPEQAQAELERLGIAVLLGADAVAAVPPGTDLVVTSPGWRPDQPLLATALAAGVPVWGEVELAWRLRRPGAPPWLAVTGTNGKTTTVGMLTSILTAAGHRAVAAGNIGTALVDVVTGGAGGVGYDGVAVVAVELSSFQLHWSRTVAPHTAVVLNVADDHLDWHGSTAAYAGDKGRVFGAGTCAVYNVDDPWSVRLAAAGAHRVGFTLGVPRAGDLGVVDGALVDHAFVADPAAGAEELATTADVGLPGAHNVANALAAAALARSYGVPACAVRDGLRAYTPAGHRNALVATVGGVAWVDDSKATNPHAAAASLAAYSSVVWVAGGLLKGADVTDLVRAHAGRLRGAVLLGRDRAAIADSLARHAPDVPVVEVDTSEDGAMATVVRHAAVLARPGDTVLLAPAAASMDMFSDYRHRGDAFAAAVRALGAAR